MILTLYKFETSCEGGRSQKKNRTAKKPAVKKTDPPSDGPDL